MSQLCMATSCDTTDSCTLYSYTKYTILNIHIKYLNRYYVNSHEIIEIIHILLKSLHALCFNIHIAHTCHGTCHTPKH